MSEPERKKNSMIVIVIFVVIGLLLAGAISYFIANKIVADRSSTSKAVKEPGVLMKLGDPKDGLIVNIGGLNSGRYLKIGIVLDIIPNSKESKENKNISSDEVIILDTVIHILRSQKIEDFDPAKQDKLKSLLMDELNKVLGADRINQVFITNFVLQ